MSRLAEVDPSDDAIWRWVLHHYRFDPERRQRRNVVVAAYDNEAEFEAALATHRQRIHAEVDAGARDDSEHVVDVVWPPGDHDAQVRGRTVRKATVRGVDPRRVPLDGPLPRNKVVFGWDSDVSWAVPDAKTHYFPAGRTVACSATKRPCAVPDLDA